METLRAIGNWIWTAQPNWELILRFIEVLVWPAITLVGIAMVQPGRIVTALLDGGELGVGPATMRFAKRVEEIAAAVDDDEVTAPEPEVQIVNPLEEAADPYTTVMNGWGKVIEGLEEVVRRGGLEQLDKRDPMATVLRARRTNLIGKKLEHNIQALWDFRNKVRHAGSRRLERLGLTQLQADEYYSTADRVRRGMMRALSYREAKGTLTSQPMRDDQPPSAPMH